MCLLHKPFENTVEKGEIALNEQFLLFPVFSTLLENFPPFSSKIKLLSANSFSLEEPEILLFGKGLSQLEVVLLSNLQNLGEKYKEIGY